jgi:hypothetical protein
MELDITAKKKLAEFIIKHDSLASESTVDATETRKERCARIAMLEADPEAWFQYYFAPYATSAPAPFHKAAAARVINNPEWYEVRNWSRELAKSTRTMMEVLYLVLTGKKRNVILVSNSKENADRLLLPYMVNLEKNQRITNDYGTQQYYGNWASGEFITLHGVAFRALGAGQSPRGTRNEANRPDIILIDDIDTDADCLNPDIIDKRWEWIEQALIPTRSISNPLLIIFCGNIIAEDCCVVRAAKCADAVDIVNIRDTEGKSTWPQKNSEEDIDRVLATISYASQQKEYYNNPMNASRTFAEITWGKCPPISELQFVVAYADPAPGNKDLPGAKTTHGNSRKAVFIVGHHAHTYYIYKGYLDVMGTHRFISCLYACRDYIVNVCHDKSPLEGGRGMSKQHTSNIPTYFFIENNSLQDPFYDQVYRPLIHAMGVEKGSILSVQADTRKKPEKWFRIEAALQPLVATGNLVFNIEEKDDEHMKRLEAQFKAAKPTSKQLDGPDCIEGAIFIIKEKLNAMAAPAVKIAPNHSGQKGY